MSEAIKQPCAEPMILLQGVNKWYGQFHVLKDINLSVQQGERIVLWHRPVRASPPPFAASTAWKSTSRGASWSMAPS